MATILDLNKSISDMSEEEVMDLIMKVRQARRAKPPKKTSTKGARKPPKIDVDTLIGGASKEDLSELIAMLEEAG